MMKQILKRVVEGQSLSMAEAEQVMGQIMSGEASASQIAALLTALSIKGEVPDEIAGFAKAMRRFATPVRPALDGVVDTCGTGGDGAKTFNISTAASFVAAGAGVPVAKHGNRAVSSKSGSADVLAELGVFVEQLPQQAMACLEQAGICFLYAPLYHQAMKYAAGPRRELGFRTVFNILGPLTNPAGAKRQLLGTYAPDLPMKVAEVLRLLGSEHALVVHGEDGLDELTVTGKSYVAELRGGKIKTYTLTPEEMGLARYPLEEIRGGSPRENAEIIRNVLQGKSGAPRDVVLFNAAAAIYVGGKAGTLQEGVKVAREVIDSGRALETLQRLVELSYQLAEEKELAQ